ncbi:MAG: DNA/RNA nuclease SfsA [Firmicutes bacterium]|nr:DNA/RNA nuclease SfsA [Bacillota bacterium]
MQIVFTETPREGLFIERPNRFVARVKIKGEEVLAHVPSSGRMQELLYPGAKVFLLPKGGAHRKTPFDLILAHKDGILVSLDSRLPNLLVYRSLQKGALPPFGDGWRIEREVNYGSSRIDFRLQQGENTHLLEVKSVTLVQGQQALFPDAPTDRGTRHLTELTAARQDGYGAAALFIIQRADACTFSPNWNTDKNFAIALVRAAKAGVKVYAYDCRVTLKGVSLLGEIPVIL